MRLIIILIIIILFIIIFLKKNKETFFSTGSTNINLGDKDFNSKNNIFLGYNEAESKILKEQLDKIDEFEMDKSNLILSNDDSRNLTNISIDKNRIQSIDIQDLMINGENIIKYFNSEINDNGDPIDKFVFYNHQDQMKGLLPPNKLCIDNKCIEKKHLGMANGNRTLKLQNSDATKSSDHMIPIYTYSGGFGGPRFGKYPDEEISYHKPFEYIFYQMNNLVNAADDYGKNEDTVKYDLLPSYLDDNYDLLDIGFKYKDFKYYALYNEYSKSYLAPNGFVPTLSKKLIDKCIFSFEGYWQGIHHRIIYHIFANYNLPISLPLGIYNLSTGKYLCQERWGWNRNKNCSWFAVQNRPWFRGWEEMSLVRTVADGNINDEVYIMSKDCNRGLSAWKSLPFAHFSSYWGNSQSLKGHNVWKIIPLPDQCGEKCKADFATKTSCKPPFCKAPFEKNVPKNLQCPIDRPVCRYYNGEGGDGTWLGTCTKEGNEIDEALNGESNINYLKVNSEYRYAKPDQRLYKTKYNSDSLEPSVPVESQNKDFYSEYSLRVAKNENDKNYDPDVFRHFHNHDHDE